MYFNTKLKFAAAAALILTGCSTEGSSPGYITYALGKHYDGRPASEFFMDYGYPAGLFGREGGNKAYRWVSSQYKVTPPQAAPVGYANYEMVDSYRGITDRYYCELRIYANSGDIITGFAVAVDSTGRWSASRCSELFN